MCERAVIRAKKGITLVILNEDLDIIRIIKSLENSGILIDRVIKTVKHEIINKTVHFLVCY